MEVYEMTFQEFQDWKAPKTIKNEDNLKLISKYKKISSNSLQLINLY